MKILDYGLSFINSTAKFNRVRFWVESRTRIVDERNSEAEEFYQCASCKSENTFVPQGLFKKDNYDFLPIFGPRQTLIFRRKAWLNDDYRTTYPVGEPWGLPILDLREAARAHLLEGNEAVRQATFQALPVVAQTEIWNDETGLRAIVEYPVKTINIHVEKNLYQVDTGPLALPDLSRRWERFIDSLSLAFVAFNASHFVDVVIETATPLSSGERAYHYSELKSLPATNRLYCIGDLKN